MSQAPTLGRIVLYTPMGDAPGRRAAIVTEVGADGLCSLAVFHPLDIAQYTGIAQSDGSEPHTWSWPPRVKS
jgi:hypothetical protein